MTTLKKKSHWLQWFSHCNPHLNPLRAVFKTDCWAPAPRRGDFGRYGTGLRISTADDFAGAAAGLPAPLGEPLGPVVSAAEAGGARGEALRVLSQPHTTSTTQSRVASCCPPASRVGQGHHGAILAVGKMGRGVPCLSSPPHHVPGDMRLQCTRGQSTLQDEMSTLRGAGRNCPYSYVRWVKRVNVNQGSETP